ncbi:MAG: H-NS histone family protein [Thiohalomonadaceae bacterium]
MQSYNEIQEQIKRLQQQAEEVRLKELADVINEIKAKVQEYGLTARDLGLSTRQKSSKSKLPAKYKKGDLTWTGRGRQPKWVGEHLAAGGQLADLAV